MIKPINDYILLKEIDDYQEKKIGSFVLEANNSEESDTRLKKFEVVAISDGYLNTSTNTHRDINSNIKVGSYVIMDKFSGKKFIDSDGSEFILVREAEIQGIIEE